MLESVSPGWCNIHVTFLYTLGVCNVDLRGCTKIGTQKPERLGVMVLSGIKIPSLGLSTIPMFEM